MVHSVMMVAICFVFPLISHKMVIPYIAQIYGQTSEVLSEQNIVLSIIMIVFVFIIPTLTYFLIAKNRPFPKAERYFNGAGTKDQVGFTDSFGKEKKEFLTNWYMQDIFGEDKMYKPSVYTAIGILAVLAVVSFIVGGGF